MRPSFGIFIGPQRLGSRGVIVSGAWFSPLGEQYRCAVDGVRNEASELLWGDDPSGVAGAMLVLQHEPLLRAVALLIVVTTLTLSIATALIPRPRWRRDECYALGTTKNMRGVVFARVAVSLTWLRLHVAAVRICAGDESGAALSQEQLEELSRG